jgi:hypothetical protein
MERLYFFYDSLGLGASLNTLFALEIAREHDSARGEGVGGCLAEFRVSLFTVFAPENVRESCGIASTMASMTIRWLSE